MKNRSTSLWCALVASLAGTAAALACTAPIPPPPSEEPEHEVWSKSLGYNRATGKNEYLVGVEVIVMPPAATTTCKCGVNINNVGLPASFIITDASVVVANSVSHDMSSITAFDDLAENEALEIELEDLKDAIENPTGYAFEVDVEPFEPPSLEPEDVEKMLFFVQVAPADLPSLVGRQIQFAAGSDDPLHPLTVFTGYQTTVNFPVIAICIGEANNDRVINFADITAVITNWGRVTTHIGLGDANADGAVNFADVTSVLTFYGSTCP